jgi:hypothetical protein
LARAQEESEGSGIQLIPFLRPDRTNPAAAGFFVWDHVRGECGFYLIRQVRKEEGRARGPRIRTQPLSRAYRGIA